MSNTQSLAQLIWDIAELLRGDYKQADYGKIILPLTVLRRLDWVLTPTKPQVLKEYEKLKTSKVKNIEPILNAKAGPNFKFHNRSNYDFEKLAADPNNIAANLRNYINGFSVNAREIIEYFSFDDHITRLDEANLLYLIIQRFKKVDLHPGRVKNVDMGNIFEELIRKFAEASNETAGEHFTPREVIKLMVAILFNNDRDVLRKEGTVRSLYDPACSTGGMLSIAEEYLYAMNSKARLELFGQEINPESYAICKADMLIKGENPSNIKFGNTFTVDGLEDEEFDYMLSNPPFGVEWRKAEKQIVAEHANMGYDGRFGAGLPKISDGSLLFLQHMISKMKTPPMSDGKGSDLMHGSRIGIVFNGSPLFSGAAGGGESNIRRWIIENDWLEAIIALPDQLFYNTGISTYIWIVTNNKEKKRKGKIQLINASGKEFYTDMPKSYGDKRHYLTPEQTAKIVSLYDAFKNQENSKIFNNNEFGFWRITVERPLKLNFYASPERLEKLKKEAAFTGLIKSKKKGEEAIIEIEAGTKLQEAILNSLRRLSDSQFKNINTFKEKVKACFKKDKLSVPAQVMKAIERALSERDETADIIKDANGDAIPDPELRDYENVPLTDDIQAYFDREVKPFVPDAWIDHSKTKVGYEINFSQKFYVYKELQSLSEIKQAILKLEEQTDGLIKEIVKL